MNAHEWAAGPRYVEYSAQWRPDSGGELALVRFIGQYEGPLIVDGAICGHYIKPLLIEASGAKWLTFTHPPAPRKYFQYPHLLECSAAGPGRVVAGSTLSARALPELPRAIGAYETRLNAQWV